MQLTFWASNGKKTILVDDVSFATLEKLGYKRCPEPKPEAPKPPPAK